MVRGCRGGPGVARGFGETHDDTAVWWKPLMTRGLGSAQTLDDTGLVLNEKPMMTETPQTRKNFFLEKKVGPRKIFFGIFFLGGFAKPVSSWVLVDQTLACHIATRSPAPRPLPNDPPRTPHACHGVPGAPRPPISRPTPDFASGFLNRSEVKPDVSWGQ